MWLVLDTPVPQQLLREKGELGNNLMEIDTDFGTS